MVSVKLFLKSLHRMISAFSGNGLYSYIPFVLVILFLALFLVLSDVAAPVAPFIYSLF